MEDLAVSCSPKSFGFFCKELRQVSKKNKYVIYRLKVGLYGEKR